MVTERLPVNRGKRANTNQNQKQKTENLPMLAREPPLQVLPGFLRVLGLGLGPVPRVYPSEAVADPVPKREREGRKRAHNHRQNRRIKAGNVRVGSWRPVKVKAHD